ncbi:MAG: tRNA (adenosine(37)-N6)-threonylcarbamoyltransferase complex dimerization subunit type 1 TsaB [Rikenellaceae bacterium]|nr:tRNA (adenosine(37)-N6)-threonylcarbamoyltransferase complex dimerization subunit type 1 TsaB [Rikenellaceae bacterium]
MSLILCIETGTNICSAALSHDGALLSLRESEEGRDHAQRLASFIDELLRENDIDADELDAVAVGMGPGSYTGLRIGTSVAKGICYGAGKPLIGVSSLKSLAMVAVEDYNAGIIECGPIEEMLLCPMIDARRMEVYSAVYDSAGDELLPVDARIIDEDSLSDFMPDRQMLLFGGGASKCRDVMRRPGLVYASVAPSARGMAALADSKFKNGEFENVAYFEPFYLKEFVAGISKKGLLGGM